MKKKSSKVWILILIVVLFGTISYFSIPKGIRVAYIPVSIDETDILESISLPEGYEIEIVAKVPGARSMVLSPSGTLFVGTRTLGKVYAVKNGEVITIASDLNMPNGVVWHDGDLYVAENNRILKLVNIEKEMGALSPEVVNDDLPSDKHHGWKFIRLGPDHKLYVPVGAPCNLCLSEDPYASITRMNLDGSEHEVIARGVRNTVGFDFHPETKELWFTDNGRDWMGDDMPPDELNKLSKVGEHFGYPYCHGKKIQDTEFKDRKCDEFVPASVELGPHVAALGMRFYTGEMFNEYEGHIFIAEHGSWNRKVPIGYRITVVDPETLEWDVFADGWLKNGKAIGRPVDIELMKDGSMLVSDDKAGLVYRIYKK